MLADRWEFLMSAAYLKGPPVQRPTLARSIKCSGKIAFDSAVVAQVVASRCRGWDAARRQIYRCDDCGAWHLGTDPHGMRRVNLRERRRDNLVRTEGV